MLIDKITCGNSSRGRISPTIEFQAGDITAVQQPNNSVKNNTVAVPATPPSNAPDNIATPTACTTSVLNSKRRRSVVSANTPEGKASTNIGKNTAVCTKATTKEEACSSTIIQAAAMAIMALAVK